MQVSSAYADADDSVTDATGDGDDETQWTAHDSEEDVEEVEEAHESDVSEADPLVSEPWAAAQTDDDERGDERPGMLPTGRSEEVADDADDEDDEEEETDANELSGDSLPSELATGRTGVDELLESMFTERIATGNTTRADNENESVAEEHGECDRGGVDDETARWRRSLEQFEERVQHEDREDQLTRDFESIHEEQGTQYEPIGSPTEDQKQSRSALIYTEIPDATPSSCPAPPPTTKRAVEEPHQPSHAIAQSGSTVNPVALRIITFDVGGTLFRCKESLIRKYPLKRLNQVISCGCERIGHDTFFIDRNPQHFEVILDWYRTGNYVRHPHVREEALQEDAKYFDLYHDLFPDKIRPALQVDRVDRVVSNQASQPPRVPPRPHRHQQHPQQVSSGPMPFLAEEGRSNTRLPDDSKRNLEERRRDSDSCDETLRFCKSEHRTVEADGIPVVYMVRKHEHLLVASVKGRGKLLVRVCDATGMRAVHVQSAVLFDSQSYFYLQGGRAKLQHCLLPGGHAYTFWMEIDPTTVAIAPSQNQNNGTKSVKHELDVEFKLLSAFRASEQLTDSLDEELQALATNGGDAADVFPVSKMNPTASTDERPPSFSPYMFLPPRYQQQSQLQSEYCQDQATAPSSKLRDANRAYEPGGLQKGSERDAIAKQLFSQSSPAHVTGQKDSDSSTEVIKAPSAVLPSGKTSKKNGGGSSSSTHTKYQSSTIKRNGAAIVSGGSKPAATGNNNRNDSSVQAKQEKITIYQHAQLKIEQSPREAITSSPRSSSNKTKNLEVATKYQDHQPRLFR